MTLKHDPLMSTVLALMAEIRKRKQLEKENKELKNQLSFLMQNIECQQHNGWT